MKLNQFVSAGLFAMASIAAPVAHAGFVVGSASSTGFFANEAGALDLPGSLVSTLTSFDLSSVMSVGGTSGDLQPDGFGEAFDFTILLTPQLLFEFSGFSFVIQDWGPVNATALTCSGGQCSDGIGFSGSGFVTGNGFDSTGFSLGWSAQGSCNEDATMLGQCGSNATASWSASISATGDRPADVPEPGTLALAGLALAGLGLARRRQRG